MVSIELGERSSSKVWLNRKDIQVSNLKCFCIKELLSANVWINPLWSTHFSHDCWRSWICMAGNLLTDITAWWKVGNISGWFGAVMVSKPCCRADAPTSVGFIYSGTSIFTDSRFEALWWPIHRWLSSLAVISWKQTLNTLNMERLFN